MNNSNSFVDKNASYFQTESFLSFRKIIEIKNIPFPAKRKGI
jgi:hypothetical protein